MLNDLDRALSVEDAIAAVRELEQPLDQVSATKFRAAAKLLEEVREHPGVLQVLDFVRPRLIKLRPNRKPNLQRLFYQPLEDLLIRDSAPVGNGMIPRRLPALVWQHLVETGDVETRRELELALRRTKADDIDGQNAIARRLWPWAARLLATLVADPVKSLRLLAGDSGLLSELKQISALLHVAGAIDTLKQSLPPRPISGLSDEQMGLVRRALTVNAANDAERTYALILAMMVRMARRTDFLESIMSMTLALSADDKQTVHRRLSRLVMTEVGDRVQQMSETNRSDLVGMADGARHLVSGLLAAEKVFKDDPKVRRQLSDARHTAETTVTKVVDTARGSVSAAIEIGPDAPVAALVDVENSILALRKCQSFAGQIGLQPAVNNALGGIIDDVCERAAELFDSLKGRRGAVPGRGEAMVEMYWAVRMVELAGNPDDADRLRLQGLEAIG